MLLLAAASHTASPCSALPSLQPDGSPFPEITGGSACDEDNPTPGTCNCSGTPMGPESWRLSKPEWFGTNLTSIYEASASLMGKNVGLRRFQHGHKATMVINIASA